MDTEAVSARRSAIEAVVRKLLALELAHPVRVAVDGRTASGKTTFADKVAAAIGRSGRPVVRASIDDFHQPRAVRHRQGRLSADGYYEDARDLAAVRVLLLDPLGPGGDRLYVARIFDLERDIPVDQPPQRAKDEAILIVDGTFLQRPELREAWDFVIFLDVPEGEAMRRGVERDAPILGGGDLALQLYRQRYGPAFARYEAECRPAATADVIIGGAQ